ncbi:MAG: class I SAM-dependent methyltransferase [Micromonosporaceae bacterium]
MDDVRSSYDMVAHTYLEKYGDELDNVPLERSLLRCFAELTARVDGPVADVGCGPGHVTCHLYELGCEALGIDLSPRMVEIAQDRYPGLDFAVGSMLDIPAPDDAWAGAVALYSIIHLNPRQRETACRELARVIRPGGGLLVGFHVRDDEHHPGQVKRLHEWWGDPVQLEVHFLDPAEVAADFEAAGFALNAKVESEAEPGQYPSQRGYLLATR